MQPESSQSASQPGDGIPDGNDGTMSTQRCAYLMTVAMANKLHEVWISTHPMLLFTYLSQYMPATAKWFVTTEVICVSNPYVSFRVFFLGLVNVSEEIE